MAGCGFQCAKYTLFFFNAIFWLIGAAILAIGIWIAVDPNLLEYMQLGEFEDTDKELKYAAYFLIAAGAFIFILGFCGCCGAIRESQCLLGFYIICMLLIIGLEIAAAVFAYLKRDEIIDKVEAVMEKGIEGYDGKNALSKAWHKAMIEFNCCGVYSYKDFKKATGWDRDGDEVPKACCVLTEKDAEDPKPRDNDQCQDDALANAESSNELKVTGCSESIKQWVRDRAVILIGIGAAVAVFELLIMILAIVVCCQIRRKE